MALAMASPRPPAPRPTALTAFLVGSIGIATFSGMDAVMKGLVIALGIYPTMLFRMWSGVAMSGILFAARPVRPARATMRIHLVRGILTVVMAMLFFWGLAKVPLAQAIALAFIAPLISLFLAAAVLGETIGRKTIVASIIAFASSRLSVGKVPVSTNVLPAMLVLVGAFISTGANSNPQASNRSTALRFFSLAKKCVMLAATIGPTSCTPSNAFSSAFITASIAPKCFARSLAVVSPTWRIPSAKIKRCSSACFTFSSSATTLVADLSPMRSRPASCACVSPNKSAAS